MEFQLDKIIVVYCFCGLGVFCDDCIFYDLKYFVFAIFQLHYFICNVLNDLCLFLILIFEIFF